MLYEYFDGLAESGSNIIANTLELLHRAIDLWRSNP